MLVAANTAIVGWIADFHSAQRGADTPSITACITSASNGGTRPPSPDGSRCPIHDRDSASCPRNASASAADANGSGHDLK
jgi:hypothetical protein